MTNSNLPDLDYESIDSWDTLIFLYNSALKK